MLSLKDDHVWQARFKSCGYATRLLDKLGMLNVKTSPQLDLLTIQKAIYYAKKYHGEQKRQSGEPYYSHPLEVAYRVADYLFNTEMLVTSILHDTLEDTELTFEMIDEAFGVSIAEHVMDLTRIKHNNVKMTSAETIQSLFKQKNMMYY